MQKNSNILKHFGISLLVMLLVFSSFGQAQEPSLELTLYRNTFHVMYISDFDFLKQGTANYIFDVYIREVNQDWPNTKLRIEIVKDGLSIATAESNPFLLEKPGSKNFYRASNIDLINTGKIEELPILFDLGNVNSPDDDFQNKVLASGKIPRGDYLLILTLSNDNWTPSSKSVRQPLNIINPSTVQLITPGVKVGSGAPEVIQTEFPVYQFNSDATEFTVYIYEKLPHHTSIDDVISSSNPVLEYQTNSPVFTYNNFAGGNPITAQPLQTGSTYFWFVDAEFMTTSGLESIRSEVWQFKIVEPGSGNNQGNLGNLMQQLQQLLGPNASQVLNELSGFNLDKIYFNGSELSMQELMQVIDDYQNENIEILDLTIQ